MSEQHAEADGTDGDDDDVQPWDRQPDEPSASYAAFRLYRDMPAAQRTFLKVAEHPDVVVLVRQVRKWAARWAWVERADAWDDEVHHAEDRERLEAIRQMHTLHRQAGRAAMMKALTALQLLRPEELSPGTIARLMDLGAKLERGTLIVSVEELQGLDYEEVDGEDPWERIAAELDPANYVDAVD